MNPLHFSLCILGSLAACGWGGKGPGPDVPNTAETCNKAAEHSASLSVGYGEDDFNLIEEDTVLTPATAGQGGHHIWTSLKATGLNPGQGAMLPDTGSLTDGGFSSFIAVGDDPVLITVEISFPGSNLEPYSMAYDTFLDGDTENASLSGITALVNAWTVVAYFEDQETAPAQLFVSIKDACGTIVSDRKDFKFGLIDIPGFYGTGYG